MPATATKKGPKKSAKANAKKAVKGKDQSPTTSMKIEDIRAELISAREKFRVMARWQSEKKYDEMQARIAAMTSALAVAEAQCIPEVDQRNVPEPAHTKELVIADIDRSNNYRPINEVKVIEIMKSLKASGQIDAVAVNVVKGQPTELVYGFHRCEAMIRSGGKNIRADIYHDLTAEQIAILRSIENEQRAEVNEIDRTMSVKRNIDAARAAMGTEVSDADVIHHVAANMGKAETYVRDRMYLSRLGTRSAQLVIAGRLPLGQAREIAKIGDEEHQYSLAIQASRGEDGTGGWSVERTRNAVNEEMLSLKTVAWLLDSEDIANEPPQAAVPCATCVFNTANDRNLFEHDEDRERIPSGALPTDGDSKSVGRCTRPDCFKAKTEATEKLITVGVSNARKAAKKEKGINPASGLPYTSTVLAGQFEPTKVKPSTFARRIAAHVDPATGDEPQDAKSDSPSKPATRAIERTPEEIAESKAADANRRWRSKFDETVKESVLKGGLWSVLAWEIARQTIVNNSLCDVKKASKLLAQNRTKKLLSNLFVAKPADVEAIVGEYGFELRAFVQTNGIASEILEEFGKVLGLKLDPLPKLDDFMPKAKTAKGGKKTDPDAGDEESAEDKEGDNDIPF